MKQKYKIEIEKVYPKKRDRYAMDLRIAKKYVRNMLEISPQGIVRLKELKADGSGYKSKSSHWWAKNRETNRDRIVNL